MDQSERDEYLVKPDLAHMRHLPELEQLQSQISEVLEGFSLDGPGDFVFATKVCCYTIADVVADVNRAILASLKIGSYSAAESLSRTSLENSMNLIFFNNDRTSNRPKSILLNYFARAKKGAQSWYRHAAKTEDVECMERAKDFEESLDVFRALFGDLEAGGVKGWPDAAARFRDAGYEQFYHVLFVPASDSVHSFSNDIHNRFLVEKSPITLAQKHARLVELEAEKISFAFYLATHAILFFCAAASHIAERAEDKAAAAKFEAIGETIQIMIAEHERVTTDCIERLAPGMNQLRERQQMAKDASGDL